MPKNKSEKTKNSRDLFNRVDDIFNFIENQQKIFPKSRLKEIGINPKTAEKWLELIEFIQKKPKIRVIKSDHNTLVEKVEGKYQAHMRKIMTDPEKSVEERIQSINDYIRTILIRERLDDIFI